VTSKRNAYLNTQSRGHVCHYEFLIPDTIYQMWTEPVKEVNSENCWNSDFSSAMWLPTSQKAAFLIRCQQQTRTKQNGSSGNADACTVEVPRSNIGRSIDYLLWGLMRGSLISLGKCRSDSKCEYDGLPVHTPFQIHNSRSSNHTKLYHFNYWKYYKWYKVYKSNTTKFII